MTGPPPPYGPYPYGQQPTGPHQPPMPGYPPPGYMPRPEPKNGLGLTALILGGCGILIGLFPIGFWIAGPLAFAALVLAFSNLGRLKRSVADNTLVTVLGLCAGLVAALLAIIGAVIVFGAVNTVSQYSDCLDRHRGNPNRFDVCSVHSR